MNALSAENVDTLFRACLFEAHEDMSGAVLGEGILHTFGFHPERLAGATATIRSMLAELPKEFHEKQGGGWSFLNACMTAAGEQWGEHRNMEQLMALGIASGYVKILIPRDMWKSMPGGMPYFVVLTEDSRAEEMLRRVSATVVETIRAAYPPTIRSEEEI